MIIHARHTITQAVMSLIYDNRVLILIVLLIPHAPLWPIEGHFKVEILIDNLFNVLFTLHFLGYPLKYVVNRLFNSGVLPIVVAPYGYNLPPELLLIGHELLDSLLREIKVKLLYCREGYDVDSDIIVAHETKTVHGRHAIYSIEPGH